MVEYSEKCCINICKRLLISFHFVKTDMYFSIISICIIVFFQFQNLYPDIGNKDKVTKPP